MVSGERTATGGLIPSWGRPQGLQAIDIGRLSRAFPVTPPCVQVRTRRFGRLSRTRQPGFQWSGRRRASWTLADGLRASPLPRPRSTPKVWLSLAIESTTPAHHSFRSGLRSKDLLCPLLTSATRSGDLTILSVHQRTRRRSPEVSLTTFTAHPPDLQVGPLMGMDFVIFCSLVRSKLPPIRFLFVGSRLCSTLPSDPTSR